MIACHHAMAPLFVIKRLNKAHEMDTRLYEIDTCLYEMDIVGLLWLSCYHSMLHDRKVCRALRVGGGVVSDRVSV